MQDDRWSHGAEVCVCRRGHRRHLVWRGDCCRAQLPAPSSLCPAHHATRLGPLGIAWGSSLLQLAWALVSQYLILFRNELIHCFKNILRRCEAIISVLNGIKAKRAGAFTKAKEIICLFVSNNQRSGACHGAEPLGDLEHPTAERGEMPAPCLQPLVTPEGGTQCEDRRCVRDPELLGPASTERGAQRWCAEQPGHG